ncbi:MAG TPA: NAD(P)-dependent oxidoreductase [Gemmatimonadaceae bacterium]|nr:NAD(P)-dependent oxidoreductase [Gemmatimonadaceae bacterium]
MERERIAVAFMGLGAIGAPMARHLGRPPFELEVWNRTRAKAEAFAKENGVRVAATPAEAAERSDFIITCLPTSNEVESLLDGSDGILAGIRRGATLVDCTSGDPVQSRRIAARLADAGVSFIDAPVSGGVSGAERGTLTVMCGGDESVFERTRPVLESFGEKIVLCGPVGAGHALKAVNNMLLAINIWSAGEGLAALVRAGVDIHAALGVINASSGRSNVTENLITERVVTRAFPRTFRLALLDKDAGIAASVARDHKIPSPIMQLTSEMYRVAHAELGEEADHVEVVKLIERWAGVEIA